MNDLFLPIRPLRGAYLQTLMASSRYRALGKKPMVSASREAILHCEDRVRLQGFYSPQADGDSKGLVIMLHGWEGSANSSYILSSGRRLYNLGYDVFRLNFRDHGESHHLNRGIFLSILLDEVFQGVHQAAGFSGGKPVFLVGFSLGGNFALRIAAKESGHRIPNLKQVAAVSPVISPNRACDAIDADPLIQWYFMRKWKKSLAIKNKLFPSLGLEKVLAETNLRDMTQALLDIYEAGYKKAHDYFDAYAVNNGWLKDVIIPTLIVTAEDDPVIPVQDFFGLETSAACRMIIHQYGGHNAFIETFTRTSWVDHKLQEVFASHLN
ncbi:YheT family hydrolase [Desulfatibacillum aliphaticivorans]|uniref:YheT family hydrolase n=1 Tax=Desulfatibacillum aliphaticivorans TaxID=218208 RepID=UPI0012FACA17|nr:alpha/beta fold hydrolase [Desulfatibacillum aliphaticivorans]